MRPKIEGMDRIALSITREDRKKAEAIALAEGKISLSAVFRKLVLQRWTQMRKDPDLVTK